MCTFGFHFGFTSSSSGSGSGGERRDAQSSLNAIVKNGGRAENNRVWKLRVYEENMVAPSLQKANWRKVFQTMWANSLFRRCPHFVPYMTPELSTPPVTCWPVVLLSRRKLSRCWNDIESSLRAPKLQVKTYCSDLLRCRLVNELAHEYCYAYLPLYF